jgi:predicted Zn-dependent protease
MPNFRIILSFVCIVAILLLIPSCAVNPVTGKKQLMFMSEEQEVALGAQYDPSVVSTFGLYNNENILDFVQTKGDEMGKLSHRPDLKYHFKILDSPVVNAFAVPGGYIYLTRGILAQFNSEAELMGVLAHEMGHITARHTARQQTSQQVGQILLAGGMLASKEIYELADVAMQGMQLLFLSFSRDHEREADRLGVEYATKMGYNTHKMADFFQVLEKMQMASSHAGVPTWMSTHPDPGDRYNAVNQKTTEWQTKVSKQEFQVNKKSYLNMIDGIVYGEDPRQGFVENNHFYHPDLKFYFPFPENWSLVNSPIQVQITPEDKNAALVFSLSQEKTTDAAAKKTITDLKLTLVNSRKVKVNGLNTTRTVSKHESQNQQTGEQQIIQLLSYYIEKEGMVYDFHGICAGSDFNKYLPEFEKSMTGFATLTDASKLNIQPERIKIIAIRSTTVSLRDAFEYYKVPENRYNEMALLNNLELDYTLKRGDMIKVLGR